MFLNTVGYTSDDPIQTLQNTTDFTTGHVEMDNRGRHTPKHKISSDDAQYLKAHIMKYHPCISHYRRVHAPKRLYLPPELDVRDAYRLQK